MPRQPRLPLLIPLPRLLPRHIINPAPIRLQRPAARQARRQEQPRKRIPDGVDFIADVLTGVLTHAVVELDVGPQLVEVLGYGIAVAPLDQEAVFAVRDLERDTAGVGCDDWLTLEE